MLEEWQEEEICRERMTLLGLRLAAHMEKKIFPKNWQAMTQKIFCVVYFCIF